MSSTQSNHSSITNQVLNDLAEEALRYAQQHYGTNHPIWNSIHREIDVFCKHDHTGGAGAECTGDCIYPPGLAPNTTKGTKS